MKGKITRIAILCLFFAMDISTFTIIGYAQVRGGDISGTVILQDGSRLPGVTITITSTTPPFITRTYRANSIGSFCFSGLPFGNYEIKFEMEGFKSVVLKNIAPQLGQTVSLRVLMNSKMGLPVDEDSGTSDDYDEYTPVESEEINKKKSGLTLPKKKSIKIALSKDMGIHPGKKKSMPKKDCSFFYSNGKLFATYGVAAVSPTHKRKNLEDITVYPYKEEEYATEGLSVKELGVYVIKLDTEGNIMFIRVFKVLKNMLRAEFYVNLK
jgi:hypothetical protein